MLGKSDMKQELCFAVLAILATAYANEDFFHPDTLDELVHHYTAEEIDDYRLVSIDRDGNETVQTDDEVIEFLEKSRKDNDSFLFEDGHSSDTFPFEMEEKRSIIGYDGRFLQSTTRTPYCSIGEMENGCTAYLIGPYHAVTSRECVYDCSRRRWKTGRGLYLRRNCYTRGYFMDDVRTWTYTGSKCGNDDYDIAWILLDRNDFYSSCWMGYAYRDPMPTVSGEVCGYPGDKPRRSYYCLYCSRCYDIKRPGLLVKNNRRLRYSCDTSSGMGGGPVITTSHDSSSTKYAYGVHTHSAYTHNQGTRFSKELFYLTKQWKCSNGVRSSC